MRQQARTVVLAGGSAAILSRHAGGKDWLSRTERMRADRFLVTTARDSFLAAHVLVRTAAAQLLELNPAYLEVEQRCASCGGPHGRPFLQDWPVYLSLSHASKWVAAGASMAPIGLDVEPLTALGHADVEWSVLAPPEQRAVHVASDPYAAFVRLWTAKEALVKVGAGSLDNFADMDLSDVLGPKMSRVTHHGWLLTLQEHARHIVAVASPASNASPPPVRLLTS